MKKAKNIKIRLKKGDTVQILAGKNKGKSGKILSVDRKNYKAFVEEANIIKRHTKPNAEFPEGGIIEKEAPIHISNLMLVDPKTGNPTRTGRKEVGGKSVRYSKKTGDIID